MDDFLDDWLNKLSVIRTAPSPAEEMPDVPPEEEAPDAPPAERGPDRAPDAPAAESLPAKADGETTETEWTKEVEALQGAEEERPQKTDVFSQGRPAFDVRTMDGVYGVWRSHPGPAGGPKARRRRTTQGSRRLQRRGSVLLAVDVHLVLITAWGLYGIWMNLPAVLAAIAGRIYQIIVFGVFFLGALAIFFALFLIFRRRRRVIDRG